MRDGARGVFFALLPILAACGGERPAPSLVLATTTSVANSGLLDPLLQAFRDSRGVQVHAHLVGSGLALRMLEKRDAHVAITHAPDAEAETLRRHADWRYRKLMFNDFVLVGPDDDPARVRQADGVEDAMRRIAGSSATFVSRGDRSGTHEREELLWTLAAAKPPHGRLVGAGAGMGTTLRIAAETGAYTLTDRATWAQVGRQPLTILFEGNPRLMNTYAVILDPAGPRAELAAAFADWLTDGDGRTVIDGFRIGGVRAFSPWPAGAPRHDPLGVPR